MMPPVVLRRQLGNSANDFMAQNRRPIDGPVAAESVQITATYRATLHLHQDLADRWRWDLHADQIEWFPQPHEILPPGNSSFE